MKHHLPPLDGLKAFEAAARHLSFSHAADELCITKGAISYQIRKLEARLQCELFKRTVRQVYLTDSGQMLLQTTQSLFRELNETLMRIEDDTAQTGVTVAATTYVAARWLSKHISAFNEQFPDVQVMLQHSVNSADFSLNEVDLAIRWGACVSPLSRNQFGQIPMALFPVASPELLSRYRIENAAHPFMHSNSALTFSEVPLLCEDRPQDLWQEWVNSSIQNSPSKFNAPQLSNPRRVISDANVRVQAAIDGQGFILADAMMNNEINSGLLIAPYQNKLHGYGYTFLQSGNRIQNQHAQTLKQWLAKYVTPTNATE